MSRAWAERRGCPNRSVRCFGPSSSAFVSDCDADTEWANGAWRVFVQQYKRTGERKDAGGLTHTYVILDRVGNCLANIPGTELGARN